METIVCYINTMPTAFVTILANALFSLLQVETNGKQFGTT